MTAYPFATKLTDILAAISHKNGQIQRPRPGHAFINEIPSADLAEKGCSRPLGRYTFNYLLPTLSVSKFDIWPNPGKDPHSVALAYMGLPIKLVIFGFCVAFPLALTTPVLSFPTSFAQSRTNVGNRVGRYFWCSHYGVVYRCCVSLYEQISLDAR